MPATLVLGGVRSGKSRFAQTAATAAALKTAVRPLFIATASPGDDEMAERIARHQASRGPEWRTLEAPLALDEVLAALPPSAVAVVDCLTLWLSNSLGAGSGHSQRMRALVDAVAACPARLWLVSNEVGWGIVPDNPLARRFRDDAGFLHQEIAAAAQSAVLLVAGLSVRLKG